jgi:hypothetical protein
MNRNVIYFIIGALALSAVILGYQLYQAQKTTGIEINFGQSKISVEKK